MMRFLRRSRLLALALLLATPALGGAWLQAAHPCPSDAPWVAQSGTDEHAGHGGQDGAGSCHCVGACAGAALAVLPASSEFPVAVVPAEPAHPRILAAAAAISLRPSDRLPPSTAPPQA